VLRRFLQPRIPTWRQIAAALGILLASGGSQAALFERALDSLQLEAKAAHAEGKQLALVLTLPDCPGCLEMARTVYRDRRTEKLIGDRFRTVQLDLSRSTPVTDAFGRATTAADLARRLRAVATPSFIFIAGDGSLLYRYTGTLDRNGLRDLADYVVRARFEDVPFVPRDAARGGAAASQDGALHASPPASNLPRYPEFALVGSDGRERSLADFRGLVVALSVGYTQCPDVCPTTLSDLKAAVEGLSPPQRRRVQVLFATLDPGRDDPTVLKEYVAAFSPAKGRPFLGLRGSAEATARLINQLQLVVERNPSASGGYTLDHTAGVFLFDAYGRLRGLAPYGQSRAALRSDLGLLLADAPRRLGGGTASGVQ